MSDSESLDYLQPGFEPKSLTVPRLRSILVAHNIPYTSSAKKSQLVEIFNEQLVPQSKRILAARARAKRSSRGIFDVESSQDTSSSNPFDDRDDLPPPPPPPATTRRSRSPRKASARIKSEEPDHDQPFPPPVPSPSKRKSRASSRPVQQVSDTDTGPDLDGTTSSRRTRRPEAPPQIKQEASNDGLFRRTSDVFTSDNPFQSGSSPPAPERSTGDSRKTSVTPMRIPSNTGRRRTDGITAKPVETPVNKVSIKKESESHVVETGEEFTPEEQLELAAEEASDEETAVVRSRHPTSTSSSNWSTPLTVFFVTLLAVYAGWYRQEKMAVGYCGVGRTTNSIPSEITLPEWAHSVLPPEINVPESFIEAVEPQCEPCPLHAYCYSDYSVRCEQDYILKPHPFSLGGIVPLPPTCEPDGEKVRRVQAVADRAVEELRERNAKYECGEPVTEEGARLETPAIEQRELKEIIDKKRSKKMSNQEFEDLWGSALGEIKAREEVEVQVSKNTDPSSVPDTYLSSTSLARLPIACAVRRSVRLGLARYRVQISAVIGLVLTVLYARRRLRANRALAAQVPALVDLVLERLASQRQLGEEDVDDPWLFLPNLRDDVLRSVHSLRQREKIWQRVRAVVEQNSNVRTSQREGRSGEVGRAWEWIGPMAGDSSAAKKRKSGGGGRVSWFKQEETTSSSPVPAPVSGEDNNKPRVHHKWEESRPIY